MDRNAPKMSLMTSHLSKTAQRRGSPTGCGVAGRQRDDRSEANGKGGEQSKRERSQDVA